MIDQPFRRSLRAALPVLAVAAAIKLTMPGGPAVFRQERIGRFRRPFVVYKFRTMIPDAEASRTKWTTPAAGCW